MPATVMRSQSFSAGVLAAYPFHFSDCAGYSHVKTKDDGVGAVDESDEFVTYVFRLKERIGRKWITP